MIHHNGIPLFLAPPKSNDKVVGAITFRVGMADEDFGNHGITHLVEHLAFNGVLNSSVHSNGMTADTYTCFFAVGTASEVVDFLNHITANLASLPLDRMEAEKDILRTEAINSGGMLGRVLALRHGVQGYGLPGIRELGLNRVTQEEVAAWAVRYFTSGNAAIALTLLDVPERLNVALPGGDLLALPQITTNPISTPTPAALPVRGNVIGLDAFVEQGMSAELAEALGAKRFFRELREIDALSYTVSVDTRPSSATLDRFTIAADTLPDKADAVAGAMVDTLAALAHGRFSDEDLTQAKADKAKIWSADDFETSTVLARAINYLRGRETKDPQAALAEIETVTRQDIARVFQSVRDNAVWAGPLSQVGWSGIRRINFASQPIAGHEFPLIGEKDKLVVSDKALCWVYEDGDALTIDFEHIAGVAIYPDGAREVVGLDDITLAIEPTLHAGLTPSLLSALIDSRIPSTRIIPLPMRRPEDIPTPPEPPEAFAGQSVPPTPTWGQDYAQPPMYSPAPTAPTSWGYPQAPQYPDPQMQGYPPMGSFPDPVQVEMQYMPPQYPAYPTGPVVYPGQPYAGQPQMWAQPAKTRSPLGRIALIVLAVIFGLAALFCLLFVIICAATWSDPNSPTAFWVFLVLFIITGVPTAIFIATAARWNNR